MRFVLQVIFLYSIFPLSAQTTNSSQLDFEKAVGIHNKGEYKEALKQFDKLFFAGFSDPDIFRYRGFAKFKLNDFQGAAEDLDKVRADQDPQVLGVLGICKYELGELEAAKFFLINATKAGFDNGKGHLYLGYLYLDGHQYVEALEQLNKAENAGEKEMKLYEARGFAAFYASNLDLAISDLERVVKSGNDSLTFYEVLGLAYAGKNLFDKALPFLEKSDSLKSANSSVYFQLGNAYLERKLFTSAIEGYTKAISLNYNLPDVYLNRGKAKLAAGLTKESIADFDYLLKVNAEDIAAYRGRIEANLRLKDWPRIVTDLAIVNAFGGAEPNDFILLSQAKFALRNYQGALDDIDRSLAKGHTTYTWNGEKHSAYLQRAKCLVALKRFDDAMSALNQASDEDNSVDFYTERARALVGLGKFEEAIADLENVQKSNPKNADLFYNSAIIKEEIGDFGAAILDYTKVIALNSKDATAFYGRANSKARKGDVEQAISDLDKAIDLDSKNAAYYKSRGNYYYQMKNKDKACFDWRKAVEFGDEKARFSIDQYCNKK